MLLNRGIIHKTIVSCNAVNCADHSLISTIANVTQMSRAGGHLKDSSSNGISGSAINEEVHRTSYFSPPIGDVGIIHRRRSVGSRKEIISTPSPGESESTRIRPLLIAKAIARVSISSSDVTVLSTGDWISTQNKFKSGIARDPSKIEELGICSIKHGRCSQNRLIGQVASASTMRFTDLTVVKGKAN